MFSLAAEIVSEAARLFVVDRPEPALWTVAVDGRVAGTLRQEAGVWRLSWFDGGTPYVTACSGWPEDDVEALASTLTARLGRLVHLEPLTT